MVVRRQRTKKEIGNNGKWREEGERSRMTSLLPSRQVVFSPFLKIQCTKVRKIKLMVPSTAITLFLAEKEHNINITSYLAVHVTYVQGGKLWVLWEP